MRPRPIDDEPAGIHAVVDGRHYSNGCCFNYGNAWTNGLGTGTMESVYFGTSTGWGSGSGPGPWIMSDMEAGPGTDLIVGGESRSVKSAGTAATAPTRVFINVSTGPWLESHPVRPICRCTAPTDSQLARRSASTWAAIPRSRP